MKIINTVEQWKQERINLKDKTIGFVPTMGGLHQGHLSLVNKSKQECDITVVSIYLNPTQFNDKKDLETYPAVFEQDVELLTEAKVDYVFAPSYKVMYPDNYKYKVTENDLSTQLCGASRPGHFDGVLTVVLKLLNIIKPDTAYFGEKDYQQYLLLKGMVEALFLDVKLKPCPIVRQQDGLAISSRNRKLSQQSLDKAPLFYSILSDSKTDIQQKKDLLTQNGFTVDYVTQKDNRLYGAVFIEGVRLIDNIGL